jgi:hypothetical protein
MKSAVSEGYFFDRPMLQMAGGSKSDQRAAAGSTARSSVFAFIHLDLTASSP